MGSVRSGRVKLFSESEELWRSNPLLLSNLFRISHFRRSSTAEYSPPPLIALIVRAFLESVSHMISLQHKCILTAMRWVSGSKYLLGMVWAGSSYTRVGSGSKMLTDIHLCTNIVSSIRQSNKLTTVAKVEMPCSKAEIGYLLITLLRRKVGLLLFWGNTPESLAIWCSLYSL